MYNIFNLIAFTDSSNQNKMCNGDVAASIKTTTTKCNTTNK